MQFAFRPPRRAVLLAGALALLAVSAFASPALAATAPSLTLTNDAASPGVFAGNESVPANVAYPYTVTFRVAINGGSVRSHVIDAITDADGADLSACQALVGTTVAVNQTVTCTYTITLLGSQATPFSDTASWTFDANQKGGDSTSSVSTIQFPALTLSKSSTTQFVGAVGQVVPYSYVVTNTGTTQLTGVSVSDNNVDAPPSCPSSTLNVGSSETCAAQHTVTASDLTASSLDNVATATSNEAAPATADYSIPVVQPTLGGDFVIGDLTYAANPPSVTFWGAQWWKLNSLSGGSAPAAFKGFEDQPSAPACGQGWSTDPGNSTPPPAGPLPPYIVVIVSSKITQSGSTISGDTQHLVVVQTNAGYQGNPGHAGTGSIVATLC